MREEIAMGMEKRGGETQPSHQGKKTQGTSKSRYVEDLNTLSMKLASIKDALQHIVSKVDRVESDFNTLKTHTLDQLEDECGFVPQCQGGTSWVHASIGDKGDGCHY